MRKTVRRADGRRDRRGFWRAGRGPAGPADIRRPRGAQVGKMHLNARDEGDFVRSYSPRLRRHWRVAARCQRHRRAAAASAVVETETGERFGGFGSCDGALRAAAAAFSSSMRSTVYRSSPIPRAALMAVSLSPAPAARSAARLASRTCARRRDVILGASGFAPRDAARGFDGRRQRSWRNSSLKILRIRVAGARFSGGVGHGKQCGLRGGGRRRDRRGRERGEKKAASNDDR